MTGSLSPAGPPASTDAVTSAVLADISARKGELTLLAEELIHAPSFNPPGDVTAAMQVSQKYLETHGLEYRLYTPAPGLENLTAQINGGVGGTRLVLNAHLDVFPFETDAEGIPTVVPAEVRPMPSRIYGRGAVDMKGGAAAFLLVLAVLSKYMADLTGRITLCLVCDEESLGPLGSRYLLEHAPEVVGDALLSTEPSSTGIIRYGEKGIVVGKAVFRGEAGHAAYPQVVPNCIVRAAAFINDLREVIENFDPTGVVEPDLEIDGLIGDGASVALSRNVLNVGRISGGVRHNMIPRTCVVDVDVRTPVGVDARSVADAIRRSAELHLGEYLEHETTSANVSDKDHALFGALARAVEMVTGRTPKTSLSLGVTDCRLWRSRGIPAGVYGLHPASMAADTEYLDVDDLVTITQVHALACVDLLRGGI